MRRAVPLLALLGLVGCSKPTELMLVVKAGNGLTTGTGGQIDQIRVRAQPANDPPTMFFFDKYVSLCTVEGPDCRPTKYATEGYDGALTLPIHFLLQPGDKGIDDDIRVWVDGLSNNTVVLASGLRFQFSKGQRLWLELPLFPQCLGMVTCQEEDLACGSDTDCVSYVPTRVDSSDDAGQSPTGDLSADDLAQQLPDLTTMYSDLAAKCGGDGEPCCPTSSSNDACNDATLTCTDNTCSHPNAKCGEKNIECCSNDAGTHSCNSDSLVCEADKCATCGVAGDPCCALNSCNSGAICNSGTCQTCGSVSGMQCCANSTCNNTSLMCDGTNCVPACGGVGQACCATSTKCKANLVCNPNTNKCTMCAAPVDHADSLCAQ